MGDCWTVMGKGKEESLVKPFALCTRNEQACGILLKKLLQFYSVTNIIDEEICIGGMHRMHQGIKCCSVFGTFYLGRDSETRLKNMEALFSRYFQSLHYGEINVVLYLSNFEKQKARKWEIIKLYNEGITNDLKEKTREYIVSALPEEHSVAIKYRKLLLIDW